MVPGSLQLPAAVAREGVVRLFVEGEGVHGGQHVAPPPRERRRAGGLRGGQEGEDVAQHAIAEPAQPVAASFMAGGEDETTSSPEKAIEIATRKALAIAADRVDRADFRASTTVETTACLFDTNRHLNRQHVQWTLCLAVCRAINSSSHTQTHGDPVHN